ncbi:hypothetical protein [Paenarthrobacter sp. NPDC089316]|uniref:hypothetical protein n=1 Tax=unclassified Paenarthrobacter TaxID=2634190 RepID=UPI00342CACC7
MSNPQEPTHNQPGHNPPPVPPSPGYLPQPGNTPQPGYQPQPGYSPPPGYQPQPGYSPPPGYAPENGTPPQWQQPPSSASAQGGAQYPAPGPYQQNPYPQGQYQPGQYGQQPPRKNRKVLWIVLGIVAGVIVLAVVGVVILVNVVGNATSKARSLADEFTNLVVSGQSGQAYDNYLSQPLKDELDKQSFMDGIASLELDSSCKPNYNSVSVNSNNGNNKADLAGTLQCDGKTIDLQYVFEGTNELKMSSIRLRP